MTENKSKTSRNLLDWKKFILAILLCEGAGIIGSIFTVSAIPTWYATLNKPSFSPPNWLFGPVWTILYLLMGISLYLIWKSKPSLLKGFTEKLFYTQLLLNAAWSVIFFGMQQPLVAFLEIILMWIMIALTIMSAKKLNKTAAYLLIPYLLWVSFATLLNGAIVLLN